VCESGALPQAHLGRCSGSGKSQTLMALKGLLASNSKLLIANERTTALPDG